MWVRGSGDSAHFPEEFHQFILLPAACESVPAIPHHRQHPVLPFHIFHHRGGCSGILLMVFICASLIINEMGHLVAFPLAILGASFFVLTCRGPSYIRDVSRR